MDLFILMTILVLYKGGGLLVVGLYTIVFVGSLVMLFVYYACPCLQLIFGKETQEEKEAYENYMN
jgi:hypothetical protein